MHSPRGAEEAGECGRADDRDEQEADERLAPREMEWSAEEKRQQDGREDDLDRVRDGDADGERERIAKDDVGEGIGAETEEEVRQPAAGRLRDEQAEENAV